MFNPHSPPEVGESLEIRSVLRVAFENLLLKIGGYSEATEITGDESTLTMLRAKGQRIGFSIEGNQAFAKIQKVGGVPIGLIKEPQVPPLKKHYVDMLNRWVNQVGSRIYR